MGLGKMHDWDENKCGTFFRFCRNVCMVLCFKESPIISKEIMSFHWRVRWSGELSAQCGLSGQRQRIPETVEDRTLPVPAPGLWLWEAPLQLRHIQPDCGQQNRAGTGAKHCPNHCACTWYSDIQLLTLSLLQSLYPLSLINGSLDEGKSASAISRNLAAHQGYTVVAGNNHKPYVKAFNSLFILLIRTIFTRREAHLLYDMSSNTLHS